MCKKQGQKRGRRDAKGAEKRREGQKTLSNRKIKGRDPMGPPFFVGSGFVQQKKGVGLLLHNAAVRGVKTVKEVMSPGQGRPCG
jgi:hypothetical protein